MSTALRQPMSLEQFLAWEREQERPWEFDRFQPVAMTGGTIAHSVIATNVVRALADRIRPSCNAFRGDVKIVVAGRVRYPDAVVTCSPIVPNNDIVPDPVVVFKILTHSTASVDRIATNEGYPQTPSIRRYVTLEQDRIAATVFASEGERWTGTVLAGADAVLAMPEIGVDLPLSEMYRNLDFPAGM
jgi:Uma2 family endonuclease